MDPFGELVLDELETDTDGECEWCRLRGRGPGTKEDGVVGFVG